MADSISIVLSDICVCVYTLLLIVISYYRNHFARQGWGPIPFLLLKHWLIDNCYIAVNRQTDYLAISLLVGPNCRVSVSISFEPIHLQLSLAARSYRRLFAGVFPLAADPYLPRVLVLFTI